MTEERETTSAPVIVITGGTAGIGRATALEFARLGARVAILARGREGLDGTLRDIRAVGADGLAIPTDVADEEQVERAASEVVRRWGRIDVWVNNAMATIYAPAQDVSPEDFRRATEVTYLGAVWGTLAALRHMKPRGRGTIVQVGSALAYRSIPLQAPYCGAKAALRGFTDSLRSELLHDRSGVRLTMVQLSAFNTPQFEWGRTTLKTRPQPVPPIFQPELAARAIVRAAFHPRREFWVGWPAVKAIVGTRLVPGWIDRMLARQGYSGQDSGEPLPSERPDNLHAPVPGDHGAHGRFDAQASSISWQWLLSRHRWSLAGALAVGAVAALWWRGAASSRR